MVSGDMLQGVARVGVVSLALKPTTRLVEGMYKVHFRCDSADIAPFELVGFSE